MTQKQAAIALDAARAAYHVALDSAMLCGCDAVDRDAYNYALRDASVAFINALHALDRAFDAADSACDVCKKEVVKV